MINFNPSETQLMRTLQTYTHLIAICLLLSCTKANDMTRTDPARQEDLTDVAYGTDIRQKFNIYLPAGRSDTTTPVLFFIHGGGWSGGNKNDYIAAIPALRQLFPDAAFVLVGYRLFNVTSGANKFPVQEQDVKACIETVMNNSAKYHISRKFVLWGQSAGAHLAALYAYKYGHSFRPRAVIDQVGPTDMLSMYAQLANADLKTLMKALVGNPETGDSVQYKSSSPLKYVSATSPPTLILHGTADDVVPYQQAQQLNDRLQQHGVPHIYKLYPGEGHGLTGVGTEVNNEIIAFLRTYLH